MAELYIIPVLTIGVILGVYELMLIKGDMNFTGSHWFGHGLHAIGFMLVALFAIMNTEYFLEVTGASNWLPSFLANPWVIRIIIGLITMIKVHSASSLGGGVAAKGLSESWYHTLIIGVLVITAPLYWGLLAGFLPAWAGGTSGVPIE